MFNVTQKADNCSACAQDKGPRTGSCLYIVKYFHHDVKSFF